MKSIFAIPFLLPILAVAQLSDSDLKRQSQAMIKQLKLQPMIEQIENDSIDSNRTALIYAILKNTSEVRIHQQKGASGNKVFVHKDGQKEAVYDKDGELVKDGVNDGSYNYYHPSNEPLRHFAFDISPWIAWGQSRKDTTTVKGRIYAYMGDLEGGIRRALADEGAKESGSGWEPDGQLQALAIFLRAIEEGKAEALYDLGSEPSDEELIDVLKKLNQGFDTVYVSPK